MRFGLALVALAACFAVSSATIGIDISSLFAVSSWQCLRNSGYTFAIVRCFCSTGNPDHNCPQSVSNAWQAGFEYVDIYMFPCPQCGNARAQVQSLYNFASNVKYGLMWLDIEGPEYWLGNYDSNRGFMNDLANSAKEIFGDKLGGIYTNKNGWVSIFGDWSAWGSLPLWWAYWDESPSFDNFSPFCGWNKPAIKQYVGDGSACGIVIDKNYY
jgi:hypothetical protein